MRSKQASEPKSKAPTSRGTNHLSQGQSQESEVEVLAELENNLVDLAEYCKAWDWKGVAPGTYFAKYLPPVECLEWSKSAVETRRQQMLNPDFAKKLC